MNNKKPIENIWLNIRRNPSRKVMHSFLKWRTVVWVTLLGLIGFCIWQGTQWWHMNIDIGNTIHSIQPTIDHQLESLLEEVNVKKNRLAFLEEQAFSSQNKDLISWMTEQAEVAKTQMIGVEYLKERQVEQYLYSPVEFTLRGDYHSFGRLMNLLERSQYSLKLDSLSIATKENHKPKALVSEANIPESLIMDIVLVNTGFRSSELKNNSSIPNSVSAPQKSSEQRSNHIGADFVYPSNDGLRNVFQLYQEAATPQAKNLQTPLPLILTGVIYNERNPIAILMDGENKKSYLARVNDTILDFTVLKIEPRSVILNRMDTRIELRVFKDKEIAAF